jgi:hypothetical protein
MVRQRSSRSGLPTMMMPCLHCGGRFIAVPVDPAPSADDFEDIIHRCNQCEAEVTRTVSRSKFVA